MIFKVPLEKSLPVGTNLDSSIHLTSTGVTVLRAEAVSEFENSVWTHQYFHLLENKSSHNILYCPPSVAALLKPRKKRLLPLSAWAFI